MNYLFFCSELRNVGCNTLVKQRLCCSGMRWKEKGAGIIVSLRALVLTKNGVNFGQNLISMGSL